MSAYERLVLALLLGGAILWPTWLEIHQGTTSPTSWPRVGRMISDRTSTLWLCNSDTLSMISRQFLPNPQSTQRSGPPGRGRQLSRSSQWDAAAQPAMDGEQRSTTFTDYCIEKAGTEVFPLSPGLCFAALPVLSPLN
jgi:hypothetical protein